MAVGSDTPSKIIDTMHLERAEFYRSLSTFDTFGKGWMRRNEETRKQALEMVTGPK